MNQSLRDYFFSNDELSIYLSDSFTINAYSLNLGNNVTIYDAANSAGSNNYFLSSNGSSVFWKLVAPGVNADASYTWTNTHIFQANITANGIIAVNITANAIIANGTIGTNGQFLTSNGTGIYWSTVAVANTIVKTYDKFTATANQNTFTVSAIYTSGYIDIYRNGVHLSNADYIEVNTTAFQLSSNASTSDIIEAVALRITTAIVPAGSNTQIQINDSGVLGAVSALTFNKTTNTVTVNGTINFSGNTVNNTIYTGQALTANAAAFLSLPNTGIVSNALGVFVNSAYIATLAANVATYLATAGITANSTALQIANTIGLYANASLGTNGQFLASNGTTVYWTTPPDVSTNTAAAYTWTNTHTFQANVNFQSNVVFGNQYSIKAVALGSSNNFNINCAAGNYFTLTANGSVANLYFTNTPTNAYACVIKIANGGVNTFSFANTPKWPGAVAPTLSTNTDIFVFLSDDAGTTWRGNQSMKDSR